MSNITQPLIATDYDALMELSELNEDQNPEQVFMGGGGDGAGLCMSFTKSSDKVYFLYAPMSGNYAFDSLDFPNPTIKNKENLFLVYVDDFRMEGCFIGEISPVKGTAKTFSNFEDALTYFNQCTADRTSANAA